MATRNSNGKAFNEKVQIHEDGSEEYWRDVLGWEGEYRVSDWGRVKSLPRKAKSKCRWGGERLYTVREKILSPGDAGGYMLVSLWRDNKGEGRAVHTLVLETFTSLRPEGMEGCHEDGNYRNNRLDNLRWDTHKGNHQDRIRHGTNNAGEKNGSARRTEAEVREMLRLWKTGKWTVLQLHAKFGGSKGSVEQVVYRQTWKWLKID